MRQPLIKRSRKLGFNMTPMIDVVFLLIIFFLVSSHLAKQETRIQLSLPVAKSGETEPEQISRRVTLSITANGQLTLAGRIVSIASLESHLATAIAELGADMEVRLRCSRQLEYGNVEPIMLACTKLGIWNVTYAVYREEKPW